MKFILAILLILTNLAFAGKGEDLAKFGAQSVVINGKNYLSLNLENEPHWHTYWKNPGDAGTPFKAKFILDGQEVNFKELEWSIPKKYVLEGNILSFGYEGLQTYFYEIGDIEKLNGKNLEIHANWLICKEVCIPGSQSIIGDFSDGKFNPTVGNEITISQQQAITKFNELPKVSDIPPGLEFQLFKSPKSGRLVLQYIYPSKNINSHNRSMNLLTPYPTYLLGYKHEQLYYNKEASVFMGVHEIDWDGDFETPEIPLPEDGKFSSPLKTKFLFNDPQTGQIYIIEKEISSFQPTGFENTQRNLANLDKVTYSSTHSSSEQSLLTILLFALLGGLILNLMPCVLPVISLKLFGLIVHSDLPKKEILKHNLAYTAGVLSSFWVLGAVVIALKSAGEQIGWGFQLQSPVFVLIMMVLLFVMSLNLFGLFEFVTPAGKTLGNMQMKKGMSADFISGVLATILSTPCSAPFLGSALGFAFTTSSLNIFLVFTFIGVGLSIPFIITAIYPKLISFLPKPGAWMENLKKVLGVTLILTCIWLYDVLLGLVEPSLINLPLNTLLLSIFFAFFFANKVFKNKTLKLAVIFIPLFFFGYIMAKQDMLLRPSENQSAASEQNWEGWSESKMQSYKEQYVFVDFTAKWCLTCKVNKKLVLDTSSFSKFAQDKDIKLMRADWTKRDDAITGFLKRFDVVGVPAYFLKKKNGEIVYLGETISQSKIEENL
jgi:thiol:disulfide interchange protein/DsbC/DsbD-like thiol-disulfide interchange protein